MAYFAVGALNISYSSDSSQTSHTRDYLHQDADTFWLRGLREKLMQAVAICISGIHQNRALAIGGGAAYLRYGSPDNYREPSYVGWAMRFLSLFGSPEWKRRRQVFRELVGALAKEAFGDKLDDMYVITALCTDPDMQGCGYGSALMKYVIDKSDSDSRDTWLVTTDAHHFYERHGFSTVRMHTLNATNTNIAPVIVRVMHRPANASNMTQGNEQAS
ncbi:hypothetical protein C8Q80DRAFT_1268216 [Daedaleopsis nitida]|nr:hypothetical protein C8Q80DRAFT_1268216 [Daedaleopsis nitida]